MKKISRTLSLWLTLIALLGYEAFASDTDSHAWESQTKVIHTDTEEWHQLKKDVSRSSQDLQKSLILNLRRLPRPGGKPVILSHAVVLNNHAMQTLGHYLWTQGYDVWMPNMRGHGNGEQQSRTEPYQTGDYHFDQIVTIDWPTVHDYVWHKTRQPVAIIGYSMGGMTWQQYLSGVYQQDGHIFQSDSLAWSRSERISSFTALTVPEDLTTLSPTIKRLLHPLLPVFRRLHVTVPLTTWFSSEKKARTYTEWARRAAFSMISPWMPWALPAGVIATKNIQSGEFSDLIVSKISSPHCDYISDLITWFYEDYSSHDGQVVYGNLKSVYVPVLTIVGSEDLLAPAEYTLSRKTLYPKSTSIKQVTVEGFAHLDISFKKGVELIGPVISGFLANPGGTETLTLPEKTDNPQDNTDSQTE